MRSAIETAFPPSGELFIRPRTSLRLPRLLRLSRGVSRAAKEFHGLNPRTGEPLIEDAQEEYRITQHIAAPQPSRLAKQAIDPFHAYRTRPGRRARNVSCRKSKSAPTANPSRQPVASRLSASHISCAGLPIATSTTSASEARILATMPILSPARE